MRVRLCVADCMPVAVLSSEGVRVVLGDTDAVPPRVTVAVTEAEPTGVAERVLVRDGVTDTVGVNDSVRL